MTFPDVREVQELTSYIFFLRFNHQQIQRTGCISFSESRGFFPDAQEVQELLTEFNELNVFRPPSLEHFL